MSSHSKNKSSKKTGLKKSPDKKPGAKDKNPQNSSAFFLFIVIIATILVYGTSLKNGFTNWDDEGYILNNVLLKSFELTAIFSTYVMGNYHPVTVLTQAIEYHFFGEEATGYHIVSLLIHLLNTGLVFYFILLLAGKKIPAFIGALLFGIHPLHVESVAWISAQKDLLYVFFYLAALITYVQYSRKENRDVKKYILILMLFLLSLLSKGQAVTLPVVMLFIDWYQKKKFEIRLLLEKIPFFILSIVFGIIAILAQKESASIQDIKLYSWPDRLMFSAYALMNYLIKMIAPLKLSAYYPYPEKTNGLYPWPVYLAPLIIGGFLLIVFRLRKKSSPLIFGMLFFLTNIFLVLQLLPVGGAIIADRYSYLSFIGIFFFIGMIADDVWKSREPPLAKFKIPIAVFFSIWIISLFFLGIERTRIWQNSETLWSNVTINYPRVPIAYNDLGSYYQKHDQINLAKKNFDIALSLQPDFPMALINRCDLFRTLNKIDSAIIDGNHAVDLKPDDPDAHMNRGIALSIAGKNDSALQDFNEVIRLQPGNARAYNNRGNLYMIMENPDSAILDYNRALKYNPQFFDVLNNRGVAYFKKGDYSQAISDLTQAILVNPNNANNYYTRMQAYEKLKKYSEALSDANQAARLGQQIPADYIQMLNMNLNRNN